MTKNKITAVLGPTNTGKTHLAIETMMSFDSGMIGFPLRLLAREVYDKIIKKTDLDKVALITGEEKIIPPKAKYYLCTVESMPIDKHLDFVGIDEILQCKSRILTRFSFYKHQYYKHLEPKVWPKIKHTTLSLAFVISGHIPLDIISILVLISPSFCS